MYAAYRVRMAIGWSIVAVLIAATVWLLIDQNRDRAQVQREREAAAAAHERSLSPPPAPTPSPSPTPVAVPTPDMTGRDFDRIAREMIAFRDWMYAHPAEALASDAPRLIYHPACDCYEDLVQDLQDLADDGYRFNDKGSVVQGVQLREDFEDVVRIDVVLLRQPQVLVDRENQPVETSTGYPPFEVSYLLELPSSGRWVVRSVTVVGHL